jgi:hypothetical protein
MSFWQEFHGWGTTIGEEVARILAVKLVEERKLLTQPPWR